jgi:ubiquinone/menaquinone biosynthesis C-methylase UbiE
MGFFDVFADNVLVKRLRGQGGSGELIAQMVGTRLGDRVLVVGGGDGKLVAAVGQPTGLTGRVTAVEVDAVIANKVELTATSAGVLVEVLATSYERLPFEDAAFDVAVVPMPPSPDGLGLLLTDLWRVVRAGGRAMVIARSALPPTEQVLAALQHAGFRAGRLLSHRDGLAFYESSRPAQRNPG